MKIQVLDHGYVEFVEAWGTGHSGKAGPEPFEGPEDYEVGIIEAARQSTQGGFRGWEGATCDCGTHLGMGDHTAECAVKKSPGDARLLSYLYKNQHATPFEFAGMVIEVQAPIFVFREWHRHRTQSYNEASARYAPLADLNYVPAFERIMQRSDNKQAGSLSPPCSDREAYQFQHDVKKAYQRAEVEYQEALQAGIPKELARLVLPVGRYSKMRASANLRNWLAFMTLRCDTKAQWEIQQYANAVAQLIEEKFPHTYTLWMGSGE